MCFSLENIIPPSLLLHKRLCAPPAFYFPLYRAQRPPLFAQPIETEHECHFSVTVFKGEQLFICTVLQTHSFHCLNGLLPSRLCFSFSLSRNLRDTQGNTETRQTLKRHNWSQREPLTTGSPPLANDDSYSASLSWGEK